MAIVCDTHPHSHGHPAPGHLESFPQPWTMSSFCPGGWRGHNRGKVVPVHRISVFTQEHAPSRGFPDPTASHPRQLVLPVRGERPTRLRMRWSRGGVGLSCQQRFLIQLPVRSPYEIVVSGTYPGTWELCGHTHCGFMHKSPELETARMWPHAPETLFTIAERGPLILTLAVLGRLSRRPS